MDKNKIVKKYGFWARGIGTPTKLKQWQIRELKSFIESLEGDRDHTLTFIARNIAEESAQDIPQLANRYETYEAGTATTGEPKYLFKYTIDFDCHKLHEEVNIAPKEFYAKLLFYTNECFMIYPNGVDANKYEEIVFDHNENRIYLNKYKYFKGNKHEKGRHKIDERKNLFGFNVIKMQKIPNPIIKDAPTLYKFYMIESGTHKIQTLSGTSFENIEKDIRNRGLIYGTKAYLYQIKDFFNLTKLTDTSIKCYVPGIFEIDGEIVRIDYDLNEVPARYDKDALVEAVQLLCKIRNVYPTDSDKLGNILRLGFIMPFSKIMERHGRFIKYIYLGGKGGTLKTSMGEIIINFYNPSDETSNMANIYGGSGFDTPFRVGEKFGKSGYGFVVNETDIAFHSADCIQIMKRAIESDMARSVNEIRYWSYCTCVFASNVDIPQDDAFIRRTNTFYLGADERPNEDDIENIKAVLNENKKNDRLVKLSAIGDFCFTYCHNNPEIFHKNTNEITKELVDALADETDIDLDWLKADMVEDRQADIDDVDDKVMFEFLQGIADCYSIKYFGTIEKGKLIQSATSGLCPLLRYMPKVKRFFVPTFALKEFFTNNYHKLVTSKTLLQAFGDMEGIEEKQAKINGKKYRGIQIDEDILVSLLQGEAE